MKMGRSSWWYQETEFRTFCDSFMMELGEDTSVMKTMEKVRQRFYWVNFKDDVKDWCRKCSTCASSNGPHKRRKAPMRQYNVGSPFERIAVDGAGLFPKPKMATNTSSLSWTTSANG